MNNNILFFPSICVFPGVLSMKAEESEHRSEKKSENDNQIAAATTV